MRIINKLRRIILTIGVFAISICKKVVAIALVPDRIGPKRTVIQVIPAWWGTTRGRIIPIIFIVGMVIYYKKSTNSIFKKIILTIILGLITAIVCFGITELVTEEIWQYI